MAYKKLGVIFLTKLQKTEDGKEYYSGKSEGQNEFDVKAFVNTSKTGTKYLSVIKFDQSEDRSGNAQNETTVL